jgi:hypothetical protein
MCGEPVGSIYTIQTLLHTPLVQALGRRQRRNGAMTYSASSMQPELAWAHHDTPRHPRETHMDLLQCCPMLKHRLTESRPSSRLTPMISSNALAGVTLGKPLESTSNNVAAVPHERQFHGRWLGNTGTGIAYGGPDIQVPPSPAGKV